MEIQGKIIARLPMQSGTSKSGNAWKSQEYVIETEEQYPKRLCFRVFGDEKVKDAQEKLRKDTIAKVSFDFNAREYNGKWFNSIDAWKIEVVDGQTQAVEQTQQQPQPQHNTQTNTAEQQNKAVEALKETFGAVPVDTADTESDDLPF